VVVPAVHRENAHLAEGKIKALPAAQLHAKKSAYRYAVRLTRRSRSSFYLAFLSLPRPMYRAMCVIYAFMRLTDDIADGPLPAPGTAESELQQRLENLQEWKAGFRKAIAGHATDHPLFPALCDVVDQFPIDPQWLEDVIEGVARDLQSLCFHDFSQLQKYCYQVAGTVGLCCQSVWGADLSQTRSLAITCGEAFQLTNILRDLHEDACNSRCYLPTTEMHRFECTSDNFASRQVPDSFYDLMQFQIERACQSYQQAALLEKHLQGAGLKMFRKMFCTYYLLLQKIAQSPQQSLQQKVRLSKIEKAKILLTAGNCSLTKLLNKK